MIMINNKFDIGQRVYINTDTAQHERLIIKIMVYPNDLLMYCLACGEGESWCYEIELSAEKSLLGV